MRSWKGFVTRAALAGCVVGFTAPVAMAADVLAATGLVELLPVGQVVGDGTTDAVLHAVLRTPTGAPITGAKLKITAEAGTAEEVVEVGEGVYRFRYVAPKLDAARVVRLTVKGRTDALGAVEDVVDVPVVPAQAGRVTVTPSVGALTLGVDAEATIALDLPAGAEPDAQPSDLLVRVSSGEIAEITAIGPNRFVARYRTPGVNFPHVAVFTVVDRRDPEKVWGSASVQLQGKVDYPVTATAGATVVLRVGTRDFGPVTADATGRASVPILVPPGTQTATQILNINGRVEESLLDLRIPATRRIEVFDLPDQLPADGRVGIPVRVKVVAPNGTPDLDTTPVLTVTAGKLSDPRHAGDGIWLATFTPPDARSAVAVTLQASTRDVATQADAVDIGLVPALPASLLVSSEPATLAPAGAGLDVYASLRAADGSGLAGRTLRVRAGGAHLTDAIEDLKGGDYRANLTTEGNTDVFVRVLAVLPSSANAVEHVVVVPSRTAVAPDGKQVLTVVTTDAWGAPVGNVPVRLSVIEGGGRVPGTVTTDEGGIAEVVFAAGAEPGVATVEARAGQAAFARSFWQAALPGAKALPVSGTADDRRFADLWDAAQATLYVEREGGADAPVVHEDRAAGAPTKVAIVADPAVAPVGSSVVVDVRVLDDAGTGVAAPVELFATAGARIGALEPLGDGHYRASITIPVDAVGPVKVNVVAADGAAVSVVEIPTVAALAQAAGPEVATATTIEDKEKAKWPWMRLRVSGTVAGYTYEQAPSDDPGSLLPTSLGWGGSRGGAPTPAGLEANFRGFLPMAKYVGLDGTFRWSRYAVASDVFSEKATDNLYWARVDAVARYPFKAGKSQVHVGVKAGFRYDDLITFRGCLEPGCIVSYQPVKIPGLDVGLELGAEFWKMYLVASGSAGFAYGSQPFAANADLNLGYQITKNFFVDVGFAFQKRQAVLQSGDTGAERGKISDQLLQGSLGFGFSL